MLFFDRIIGSQGIDFNKTIKSKECDICRYWYFLGKGCTFQPDLCNGCHDFLMMSMNLSDIAILNIKCANYCCIINGISKIKAINLLKNVNLAERSRTLSNIKIYYHI